MDRLLGPFVHLPEGKGISFRIETDGEVAHPWHGSFRFADGSAEFLNLGCNLADRWNTDVVRDGLLGVHARHHAAIW